MTPSVRIVTDARELPPSADEAERPEALRAAPASAVTVARRLACNATVDAVSQPPE
jgi:hypothetical protein